METLLYLLKVVVASGILFGYYQLFLKDKTFHHYNRFYLMMILPVSIFLPLLKVSYFTIQLNPKLFLLLENLNYNPKTESNDFLYFQFVMATLGVVAVFFLVKFLLGVFQIRQFQNQFEKEEYQGINFFNTNLENAPFSFFRNLFWKESILLNSDLGRQILKHEMVHIEQKHSIDKIIIEIVKSIFWFNPFFWLIKKEIHLIHEYLADKKAVQKSDTKAFAEMLLASHFSGKVIPGSSPFLNSNLKKRLQMLQKSNTKYSYLRKILALPLIFILAFVYLVNAKNKEIKATNTWIENTVADLQTIAEQDTIKPNHVVNARLVEIEDAEDTTTKTTKTAITTTNETRTVIDDNGKVRYSATAFYQEGEPDKSKIFPTFKDAKESDEFDIMGKKVSKKEFQEFLKSDIEYKDYVFGYNNVSSEAKKSFFIQKAWTTEEGEKQLKELRKKLNEEHIEKLNGKATSENRQNATDNPWILEVDAKEISEIERAAISAGKKAKIASANAKKLAEKIQKRKAENDPWIIGVKAQVIDKDFDKDVDRVMAIADSLKKNTDKSVFVKEVKLNKKYANGNGYAIVVSPDQDSFKIAKSNDFREGSYDKIYINGKLATKSELYKIDTNSIKSIKIDKKDNNGQKKAVIKVKTKS